MTTSTTGLTTDAELAGPTRHVFVSPHYDDIALSAGGTAARLHALGRVPEVAIVFGAEPPAGHVFTQFAADMHAGWGMAPDAVIASRRAEEASAAAILGTVPTFLPFHDAIYRGERYLGDPDLFGTVAEDESDLVTELAGALGLTDGEQATTRVYVSLAAGWHVDHQIAFASGVALSSTGWDVWFYEDLPYALKPGVRDDRIDRAGVALEVAARVPVAASWDAKIGAIMAYPSQLATIFAYVDSGSSREEIDGLLRSYAREAGDGEPAERFWRVVLA